MYCWDCSDKGIKREVEIGEVCKECYEKRKRKIEVKRNEVIKKEGK